MNYNFSISYLEEICKFIDERDVTLRSYFGNHTQKKIVRHDVDRKEWKALEYATVENNNGIVSTYYFRTSSFDLHICDLISQMGHEVGFHYESLSQSRGDYEKAIDSFIKDLDRFRENFDVKTICMHGSPLSKYDNRLLWNRFNYREFGIVGDASLDVDDSYQYITDTGGSWNGKNNVRDKVRTRGLSVCDNQDVSKLLNSGEKVYVNTHPERWSDNPREQLFIKTKDGTFNMGKKFLRTIRRY